MPMNLKKPVGNGVHVPEYKTGVTTLIAGGDKTVSFYDGAGDTSSGPNLSAKWKNGTQDVPEAGKNQYE